MSATVGSWIQSTHFDLQESRWLLADTLGWSRSSAIQRESMELSPLQLELLGQRLEMRKAQVPHAYVVGFQEFWGRKFLVGPGVLIPRPETELIVEYALKIRSKGKQRVADLGAGSGCIGITLKLERPGWQVDLVEVSPDALKYADLNVREHQLAGEIGLNNLSVDDWAQGRRGFDLVVANPPYIDAQDSMVDPWVRDYEPHLALFAEEQGLAAIQSWITISVGLLNPGGQIIVEFGSGQRGRIQRVIEGMKLVKDFKFIKDYSGHDRCLIVSME